jgi:DNA-binding response OmpR family regulator
MRVLVVEDDPEISRFIVRGLAEERHLVDLVEDGVSAVEMAAAEEYDAVMLDLMLPGLDGFEVCRALRDQGCTAYIVAVTGYGRDTDRRRSQSAGFDAHLVKPVDPEGLVRLLAEATASRS